MSPRCVRVCSSAAFSDGGAACGGATCGGARSSGLPGGSSGSSGAGSGGGGEPRAWPRSGESVRRAVWAGAGGEPGARQASADFGTDGLNLSAQTASTSGSRAAGCCEAPEERSAWWVRDPGASLPPPPPAFPPAHTWVVWGGRSGGRAAAALGASGSRGAAADPPAPVVAQQPHELADLCVEGPGRLALCVAELVLEELVPPAALRWRAPHLLAGQRGGHAAIGGQRLAAVQQQRAPHGRLQQRAQQQLSLPGAPGRALCRSRGHGRLGRLGLRQRA